MTANLIENSAPDGAAGRTLAFHAQACYAADLVKRICETVGPGLPGTPQERARAFMIEQELATHLGPENVTTEEFTVSPGYFLGSHRWGSVFILLAVLLNLAVGSMSWPSPVVSAAVAAVALAFSALPVLLFIFQFTLSREMVDPLFKKQT
ncbi:MAG TPA: hypothetical protein VHO48_13235, partial [Anaerolineaceae bacterium]|nr:hypothetical protein [Anaerolineaceae bacterium]